jgi:hypothetical protein
MHLGPNDARQGTTFYLEILFRCRRPFKPSAYADRNYIQCKSLVSTKNTRIEKKRCIGAAVAVAHVTHVSHQ